MKKEKEAPSSPAMHTRHRPRKLDLSASRPNSRGLSARPPGGPMTAREGVSMQDVGFACLSPGFQTHDPVMREQLQRSLSVRDQQRSIIESRLHKNDGLREINPFGPSKGSKRRPPPGLSIVPPSASRFADERVIQSAPINNTFTGLHHVQPLTRHPADDSPHFGLSSRAAYLPANQTNNRLPPLSDVFGTDALGSRGDRDRSYYQPPASAAAVANQSQTNSNIRSLPSLKNPGNVSSTSLGTERHREYRSAEEAVQDLSGGREELLPRIVHYGGPQPVTPPSPHVHGHGAENGPIPGTGVRAQTQSGRRRPRSEYESDNASPPLGHGQEPRYRQNPALSSGHNNTTNTTFHGPFGAGRDSPELQRRKKEEFLSLCSRAWDLFHY